MWRWIFFLVLLCTVVLGVVWMAQNPGDVTLEWQGYRIDTSVGVLIGAVVLFAIVVAAIYRFWRFLVAAPRSIGAALADRRQRRGYAALGSGMVALAAGDKGEARRAARKADRLLEGSTPLTRLLLAQSAQLDGDETAAEKFFTEMLEDPDTRFLGLRGLLTQALKAGDKPRALDLADKAHRLKPESEWVAATLFELQTGAGKWMDAAVTNDQMVKGRLLEKPEAERRRAVIAYERARAAEGEEALRLLKAAVAGAPDLIPAVVALMNRHIADGQHRKAASLAERTWGSLPHPDLAEPYFAAKKADAGLARVKAAEQLAACNKGHIESHLLLARAALAAELWGEARKHLGAAGAGDGLEPPARVCRLMAEVAEAEENDLHTAHDWLIRAANAPADPRWVCDACGNAVDTWSAHCGSCDAFDSLEWRTPKRVVAIADDTARKASPALDAPPPAGAIADGSAGD